MATDELTDAANQSRQSGPRIHGNGKYERLSTSTPPGGPLRSIDYAAQEVAAAAVKISAAIASLQKPADATLEAIAAMAAEMQSVAANLNGLIANFRLRESAILDRLEKILGLG
jgi:methyl-accepting chemotaxis protein